MSLWIWWPLATIGLLASYTSAPPLAVRWLASAPPGSAFLAAAAAHTVWIVATIQRRHFVLRSVAWFICVRLASEGITLLTNSAGASWALGLELLLLFTAISAAPHITLSEQLACWRRAREAAMAQISLADGLIPWLAVSWRRFLRHHTDPQTANARLDRAQMLAELEDAGTVANSQQQRRSDRR